ncbi:uncharacterized protein LOC128199177 [Bicyclus anynana]|uniref:Uncharacterized protein LOC128199177 n=1 Tax=Bicyclus anynana TaxID=110368 RepID=A0ABM3LWP8_BICAN|nr:uncharacterized protein LOC128199177 [Bicyclus anynana]
MKICEGCSKQIKDFALVCCKCKKCYHARCLNINTAQLNKIKRCSNWTCPACPTKAVRHDDTPVKGGVEPEEDTSGSDAESDDRASNPRSCGALTPTIMVTDSHPADTNSLFNTISLQMSVLQNKMTTLETIKNELANIKTDIADIKNNISTRIDEMENRVLEVETKLATLSDLQNELITLKEKVNCMLENNIKNDQWVRRSNIQINGIPHKKDENLIKVIANLAEKCGYSLDPKTDIDFVTRVAVKNDVDSSYPKPIIVKLLSRYKKDDLLSCLRRLKDLKASDVGFPGNQNRVYINDHLSSYNKMLLQKAKLMAKEKKYSYCWVRNCTVMVRQNDNSKIIHITSEESLKKIV